jgi:hypothetical protein
MAQFLLQSNFKFGEVSPLVFARSDSPIYYNAAKRLRNCLVLPQGGARRRFGTIFEQDLTSIESDYTLYKPFFFVHQDGSKYILLFTPLKITVIYNNAVVATVVTTYTSTDIPNLDIAQSNDLVFITVSTQAPAVLKRTAAHATWSLATATFTHQPSYDFLQNYDGVSFGVFLTGTTTPVPEANNLIGQQVVVNSSSTGIFTTNHAGALWFGGGATIRFSTFVDSANMNGTIIKAFDDKCIILDTALSNSQRRLIGSQVVNTERMFSSTRGWPEKVSFFQNRLWFAKTSSLPGVIVGSNYNGFTSNGTTANLNFDDSRTLDTSAVSTVIYGRRATLINHLTSYKSLIVFTTSGVYSSSLDLLDPLTPLNVNFINLQSGDITSSLQPNILENNVIFYDQGGSRVKTLLLTEDGNNYQAGTVNILAPHLVNDPYSSAVLDASTAIDGSYLMIVNNGTERKGTLAIYNLIVEQSITAWTLQSTGTDPDNEGFRHVISDGQDVYFIIERTINGGQKLYLEKLSFDYLMDCCIDISQASSKTITGLSALEGVEIGVRAGATSDDIGFEGFETVSGGEVTIENAVTTGYVGIDFEPIIGTLPLMVATELGNNVYHPKLIKGLYIDFYESLNLTVDGNKLRYFDLDSETMNTAITPKTNFVQVTPMAGWSPRQEIVISQDSPQPMTVIGIGMTIEA